MCMCMWHVHVHVMLPLYERTDHALMPRAGLVTLSDSSTRADVPTIQAPAEGEAKGRGK